MSKAVYILASKPKGTLYIGVTSNLKQRIYQHKAHLIEGFTHRYNVCQLVYFELFEDMYHAIAREKQLKNWHRQWKINRIEQKNPKWLDLYSNL